MQGKSDMARGLSGRLVACLAACLSAGLAAACQTPPAARDVAAKVSDDRQPIELAARDAAHLRAGMRAYLLTIHAITDALERRDYAAISKSAKEAGMAAVKDMRIADALKYPPQFVLLATDTHQRFDALSETARQRLARPVTRQLSDILANCLACHETYRLKAH